MGATGPGDDDGRGLSSQSDLRAILNGLLDGGGEGETQVLAQVQDITSRREQQLELERIAVCDPLTGLLNRRGLLDALERECTRARRSGESVTLMILEPRWLQSGQRHLRARRR